MDSNKIFGALFCILGLIFIIFPMFSSELVSIIIGVSLLFFGIASLVNGISAINLLTHFSRINLVIGIIAIIFGLLFIFAIDALSFLVGLQFYIIGFIMIVFGISGLIADSRISKTTSLLVLVVGIIAIALAVFTVADPIYAPILIGLSLIIQGVRFLLD